MVSDLQRVVDKANPSKNGSADSIWSDEQYQQLISQYSGESWFNQLMDNPWLRSKQADFVTDPLTATFNWNGAAAQYYGDMRINALAWLDDKVKAMRQQDYDSAIQQVQRERAAGLNPDLNGQVTPGAGAENDNFVAPAAMRNGTSETGTKIAEAGISFIGSIIGFGQQIQALNLGSISKVSAELGSASSAREFAISELSSRVGNDFSKSSFENALSSMRADESWLNGYSRSTRKAVSKILKNFSADSLFAQSAFADFRNNILKKNKDSAIIASSPYYSEDFNEWLGNIGTNLTDYISLAEHYQAVISSDKGRIESEFLSSTEGSNLYKDNFQKGLESSLESNKANIESSKSVSLAAQYKSKMEEAWNDLEDIVKGDGSHWYNTIGLIFLNFLRAQVSQPLHIGASSSFSSGPKGDSVSRSWHF